MAVHRCGFMTLIVFTFVIYCVMVAFGVIGALGITTLLPIPVYQILYTYPTSLDAAVWTKLLWIPVWLWQFLWLFYGLSTLSRVDKGTGGFMYYSTGHMPITMYAMFCLAVMSNIVIMFTVTYHFLIFNLMFQIMMALTLRLSYMISGFGLEESIADLNKSGQSRHVNIVRGLVQNGLALYMGFADCLVLLGLNKVLVYRADLTDETSAMILLIVFMIEVIFFTILELTVWEKYSRYTFTYHIVAVICAVGVAQHTLSLADWGTNDTILVISLVITCVALLAKLISACVRDTRFKNHVRRIKA